MSILKKPYEISVWVDEWDSNNNKFVEKRLGIIGSNTMNTLNRALEPNLTRNVNGTKKLTFQMYKRYKDTITGEDVVNPFSDWLISERKVKLKYGTYIDEQGEKQDRWYDFIIKNINENSANYLYTYQLEDALVQELSRNGFGVTLDAALMNNMGTAQELAEAVLEETDWEVKSEVFVQTVEEGLVYVNIPAGTYYHISDQEDLRVGVSETATPLPASIGLAFYSCCKNKPHRFQFIYLSGDKNKYNKEDVSTDSRGIIDEANCQYYCDIPVPDTGYAEQDSFFLPTGWTLVNNPGAVDKDGRNDTTISSWYRGKRYGFAQTAKYIPLLERYCNVYKKGGVEYYGYVDNEYTSPALLQNVITNTEFKSTSGWVGTYAGTTGNVKSSVGAKVESVYGRFIDKKFVSIIDDLSNGSYDEDNDYIAYLKVTFPATQSGNYPMLLNTGFYDNRTLIKNTSNGDKWCFGYEFLNSSGTPITNGFNFVMQEVSYNMDRGNYNRGSIWATVEDGDMVFKNGTISDEDFKKREVKLVIVPTTNNEQTIYIKNIYLYRKVLNDKREVIIPGEVDTKGVIETKHYLFAKSQLDTVKSADELVYNIVDTINYNTYVPVYNTGANKVRSVTVKESNYFNILQSIAETFECWVDLKIKRNSLGAIEKKTVYLKNYIGKNNYACFRYGVNLKDIQRTYESRNIVTKLIVKQNSNEHGKNGFCTIARAGSNPIGENYIYDFSYFHNMGLLDAGEYLGCVYYDTNPFDEDVKQTGKDLGPEHSTESYNLQNYFNRIKNINEKLAPIGEELAGLQTDLAKYSAELRIQEGLRDAAASSLEETINDFFALTGLLPTQISTENMETITCDVPAATADLTGSNTLNSGKDWAQGATITKEQIGLANSTTWKFEITLSDTLDDVREGYELSTLGNTNWDEATGSLVCNAQYSGLTIVPKTKVEGSDEYTYLEDNRYELSYKLQKSTNGGKLVCVGSHNQSFRNTEIWFDGIKTDSNIIYIDDDTNEHTVKIIGTFFNNSNDYTPKLCIQPNRGSTEVVSCVITDIELKKYNKNASSVERSFYFQPKFTLTTIDGGTKTTSEKLLSCTIPADSYTATLDYSLAIVDTTATSVANLLTEYATYKSEYNKAIVSIGNFNEVAQTGAGLMYAVGSQKKAIDNKIAERQKWLDHKIALNQLFFTKYSRFIQEGTWISEEYVDDDKYYVDAQSVMYDSCYPQVAYSINVLSLSGLPGYEHFDFEVGDKTFVEDYEFFGEDNKEEVVITEMSENLDDSSKNVIKVQNFKNQFQDLFQKITATVQQTQYSTGSYQKAVALAEAEDAIKGKFIADGLEAYGQKLGVAGQTTVVQDENGITLTDSATKDQMRLIGGAIMMSVQDEETGQRSWKTGLTPEGISASRIYTGTLNAGEIQIMNVKEPVFRWDAYGLSAFDANWQDGVIGTPNPYKFVRYDKYGIYGINFEKTDENAVNGVSWKPSSIDEIDRKATFALTWEGLKVTGNTGGVARLGKQNDYIMLVRDSSGNETFGITEDGQIETTGIKIVSGTIGGQPVASTNYADGAAEGARLAAEKKAADLTEALGKDLQDQIDGAITSWFEDGIPGPQKAEDGTFTENTFPATEWTTDEIQINHEGDLYYDKATGYCYRWVCDRTEDGEHGTHYWMLIKDTEVTKALEDAAEAKDTADGKATVFSDLPQNYQYGDLFIPAKRVEYRYDSGIFVYFVGKIYRCTNNKGNTSFSPQDWVQVDYTNDSQLNQFKNSWALEKAKLEESINGCIKTNEFSIVQTTDPKTGLQVTITTLGDKELSKTYTSPDGKYILTNVGVSGNDGKNRYFMVSTEGLLQANNAVISGEIMANEGYIAGWDIIRTDTEKSIKTGELGDENSFHMYAIGGNDGADGTAEKPYLFGSASSQTWMLGIGKHFGVTSDGTLYANAANITGIITANDGDIAGWKIASNSITKGVKLGDTDSFHMYSEGQFAKGLFGTDKDVDTSWMLGIGSNFGVTNEGALYANAGRIGGFEITEIESGSPSVLRWRVDKNQEPSTEYNGDKFQAIQLKAGFDNDNNTVLSIAPGRLFQGTSSLNGSNYNFTTVIKPGEIVLTKSDNVSPSLQFTNDGAIWGGMSIRNYEGNMGPCLVINGGISESGGVAFPGKVYIQNSQNQWICLNDSL